MRLDSPQKLTIVQVLAVTKEELADAGVNVAALERAAHASGHAASESNLPRSRTVLLVKNLPYEATEDSLHELISKYGTCVKVLLPRTKALALVEMPDEQVCSAHWLAMIAHVQNTRSAPARPAVHFCKLCMQRTCIAVIQRVAALPSVCRPDVA